ncbi:Hypothetical predicted protein, partial [Xyrichtys novacula]
LTWGGKERGVRSDGIKVKQGGQREADIDECRHEDSSGRGKGLQRKSRMDVWGKLDRETTEGRRRGGEGEIAAGERESEMK